MHVTRWGLVGGVAAVAGLALACTPYDLNADGSADLVYVDELGFWNRVGEPESLVWLQPEATTKMPGDWNGDGLWEAAAFDEETGTLHSGRLETPIVYDPSGQGPSAWADRDLVPGEWDGELGFELGYYTSDGYWFIDGLQDPVEFGVGEGAAPAHLHDAPAPADYDGDGSMDIAVYRPTDGTFHTQSGQIADLPVGIPVPGDYDGDGTDDPAVLTPSTWEWHIAGQPTLVLADPRDERAPVPLVADYDGDGADEPALFDWEAGSWVLAWGPVTEPAAAFQSPITARHWQVPHLLRLGQAEYCESLGLTIQPDYGCA